MTLDLSDLSFGQTRALGALCELFHDHGPVGPGELGDELDSGPTAAAQYLRRLADRGIIERTPEGWIPLYNTHGVRVGTSPEDSPQTLVALLREAEREIVDALDGGIPPFRLQLRLRSGVLPLVRRAIDAAKARPADV